MIIRPMKRLFKKIIKLNNAGSTLVSVIVVVTFLTILATTILYLSGANFIMKSTDRYTKENFYDTETALEEIKTGLALVCSEAAKDAYVDTMVSYSVTSSYTRYETFQNRYFKRLLDEGAAQASPSPGVTISFETVLKNMVEDKFKGDGIVVLGGS